MICRSAGNGGAAAPPYHQTNLRQPPFATTEMYQQAGISQYLKLLADFVADVAACPV
jgi:hypothetical protein